MPDILTKALDEQDYLIHHGVLGQKWGVRRYQNKDGSLTPEGKARYLMDGTDTRKKLDAVNKIRREAQAKFSKAYDKLAVDDYDERYEILRKVKAFKDIDDEDLFDYYTDDDFYLTTGISEYIKQTDPKLWKEHSDANSEYNKLIDAMYEEVKDRRLDQLKVNKHDNTIGKKFYVGKNLLSELYQEEYDRLHS